MVRYSPKNTVKILTEMTSASERIRAVVAGSFLDGVLEYAIAKELVDLTEEEENAVFDLGGPLASCNQKILMGHALGLFGPKTKAQLKIINKVRNIFAHNMNEVTFDDDDVAKLASQLTFGLSEEEGARPLKDRFVNSAHYLVLALASDIEKCDGNFKAVVQRLAE